MSNCTTGRRTQSPATAIRVVAVVVAMLLVSAATLLRSQSAFSGSTTYGGDTVQAATVNLSSASSSPLNVSNLVPGDTIVRCVDVTYDGTATGTQLDSVRVYGTETSGGGLAQYLNITAEMGAVGTTCANAGPYSRTVLGPIDAAFSGHSTYASAYDSSWAPAASGESRAFRFTVTMPAETGNEAQGKTAKPTITWEIRTKAGAQR